MATHKEQVHFLSTNFKTSGIVTFIRKEGMNIL